MNTVNPTLRIPSGAAAPDRPRQGFPRRARGLAPVLAAVLAMAAAAPAQDPPREQDAPPPGPAKLSEWPRIGDAEREQITGLVAQFRKENPAVREAAHDRLVAMGDAATPVLFQRVNDRDEELNAHLFAVLDRTLEPRHAALMARESRKNKVELRRYLVRRLCRFHDPEMRPVLAALTADRDEDTAFYAHLGLLGLGVETSIDAVLERSRTDWQDDCGLIAEVLPAARSDRLGNALAERIAAARSVDQAAGLRLMRYVCNDNHVVIVRGYLGAEDHNVKKEAVNAMRALHGLEPIEKLSVFQAIEMAKEWLSK